MIAQYPILYSFRRCPYAIRARLVLSACNITCELREVVLKDKPQQMIALSPKATVPVLELPNGQVIDESYDIIVWALKQNDPHDWRPYKNDLNQLVELNDNEFKNHLDKYKYSSQNPELPIEQHRQKGEPFLKHLDAILQKQPYLSSSEKTVSDLAIFPFIRQFAFVDKDYFDSLPYPHLQRWLDGQLNSSLFKNVMKKHPQWQPNQDRILFS
jgi:glutathione S-transferase